MIPLKAKKYLRSLLELRHHLFRKPNRDAIWIFGFQKSGTSAIAGLLAHMTEKTVTIDTRYLWMPFGMAIHSGKIDLARHVKKYSLPFSRDIIKEPAATYLIDKIGGYFKLEKYVFIVRNPFDNIRSILNRLEIPGNLETIDLKKVNRNWHWMFREGKGEDYIRDLATRWLEANDQDIHMRSKRCLLIKYEDFRKNKSGSIESLATQLGLPVKRSIEEVKDHQFQPKGKPVESLTDFYGKRNLEIIREVCGARMKELGYDDQLKNILEVK